MDFGGREDGGAVAVAAAGPVAAADGELAAGWKGAADQGIGKSLHA